MVHRRESCYPLTEEILRLLIMEGGAGIQDVVER